MFELLLGQVISEVAIPEYTGPPGQVKWITPGTYQWVCPEGVTVVAVVVIAGGTNATRPVNGNSSHLGGTGGGLRYNNTVVTVPGTTYQIVVGDGGEAKMSGMGGNSTYTFVGKPTSSALGLSAGSGTVGSNFTHSVRGGYGSIGQDSRYNTYASTGTAGGMAGGYNNGTTPRPAVAATSGGGTNLYGGYVAGILWNEGNAAQPGMKCGGGGQSIGTPPAGGSPQCNAGGFGGVRIMWGAGRTFPDNAADV